MAMRNRHNSASSASPVTMETQLVSRPTSDGAEEEEDDRAIVISKVPKRPLTLCHMIMLNSIVCGLEFCASAGFTYIPPLLLKAGISEKKMSFVLGIGPFLGLFIVPVIGQASDNCRSSFGRRRPFILTLSVGCLISLFLIPYYDSLIVYFLGTEFLGVNKFISLMLLCFGVVLLDFSTQACFNPCEALLSDASKGTNQHERIFTVYSVMVSLGGCIGYLITALDWTDSSIGTYFGGQTQTAFSILIFLFTISMLVTLCIAEESHPESSIDLIQTYPHPVDQHKQVAVTENNVTLESGYESSSNSEEEDGLVVKRLNVKRQGMTLDIGNKTNAFSKLLRLLRRNFKVPLRLKLLTFIVARVNSCCISIGSIFPTSVHKLLNIPIVLRRLALADFFCWTAVMGFNFFFTDFVGQAVYGGSPNAPDDSPLEQIYDNGVRMGSWGLLLHCIVSATFAPFTEKLSNKYGPRQTFMFGMITFICAMAIMVMFPNVIIVTVMAAATGFAYAVVTIIPFTLVTEYHSDKEVYFFDIDHKSGSSYTMLQIRGIGADIAMIDSAYFLAEVLLSAVMGYMVHYTGTTKAYMVVSGIAGIMACFLLQQIVADKQEVTLLIRQHNINRNSHKVITV